MSTLTVIVTLWIKYTVVSRYYDTAGIKKSIIISRLSNNPVQILRILIWYCNKQNFKLPDIVIMKDYCISVVHKPECH